MANDDNFPTVKVEVDWTNTGTWVDESTYCRGVHIQRGRTPGNDVFAAGQAVVRLKNDSGRFGPFNTGSALSPNVVGGRPVRIHASYQGTSYAEFQGFTTEFAQQPQLAQAEVAITCLDAFDGFTRKTPTLALQQSQRTDQLLTTLLSNASWAGGTTFESGRSVPLYAPTQQNLLQELQEAAAQELGGALWMGKDGTVTFQNAGHRAAATSALTLTSVEAMQLGVRQNDLVSSVVVNYGTYRLDTVTTQTLYSGLANLAIPAQSSVTITKTLTVAGSQSVIAPVPGTDYAATDGTPFSNLTDGGNLNVTNNVWLQSWATDGVTFTATFYNSLPYQVYLTTFQVRGVGGIVSQSNQPSVSAAPGSPLVTNVTKTYTADWLTDYTALSSYATTRANALGAQHPRPIITLVGKSTALVAAILAADLSERITLSDLGTPSTAPWLTQLNGDFFIEAIDLTIQHQPRQILTAQWSLFDSTQGVPA